MSVPDLAVHARAYLQGYRHDAWYRRFAESVRIPEGAPPSFVFSCFAHQEGYYDKGTPGQSHRWCYDEAGMHFQLERSGHFDQIKTLSLWDALSERPFTHNRQQEDLCVLARKT